MARDFVSEFLLPLVRGGALHVGRPIGVRAVVAMTERAARPVVPEAQEDESRGGAPSPEVMLARARVSVATQLVPVLAPPPLDAATFRLGAALHDLLALGHPDIAGPGVERRLLRIGRAAAALAALGPPRTPAEAVERHSLLARVGDITRSDQTVHFWLGRRSYVGRVPPRGVTSMPKLRRVRVEAVRRSWLREIGVPAAGRPAFLALAIASPLGEALDPFGLDPPMAWGRILPVLRFPELCRVVAGRLVELGVDRAGDALGAALFRFAALQDGHPGLPPDAPAVAFAIRFLSHLVWLDLLFGPRAAGRDQPAPGVGLELATIVVAASRVSRLLVWPADVPAQSELGRAFSARLDALATRLQVHGAPRLELALDLAAYAASAPTGASAPELSPQDPT